MKLSSIKKLLSGEISPVELRSETGSEFLQYSNLATKAGSVMPIAVQEDVELRVSINEIRKLCQLFLDDQLKTNELAYIADIFQLSEEVRFEGETTAELVAELTDPEINGPFTKARAREIINGLQHNT